MGSSRGAADGSMALLIESRRSRRERGAAERITAQPTEAWCCGPNRGAADGSVALLTESGRSRRKRGATDATKTRQERIRDSPDFGK